MGIVDHAEKEFKIAGWLDENGEAKEEMQGMVMDNLRELLEAFSKQGHSGSSAPYVIAHFERLAKFGLLSPLTGEDDEWMDVGAWVWKYFDEISGISFLPHSDHTYVQAPYQDCTVEEYKELLDKTPKNIKWDSFIETDDNTEGAQTLACTGGSCEI